MQLFKVGEWIDRDELFRKLVGMQYTRNETALTRGTFRAKGEMLEIFPAYAESAYRINLFGDEIESIQHFDPLTGEILDEIDHVAVWPATHYVTEEETLERAVRRDQGASSTSGSPGSRSAARSSRRTGCGSGPSTTSRCSRSSASPRGSRTTRGSSTAAPPGSPPHTLIDYFPDDFVVFVDESHQTIPQIGGMYEGDRSRKQTLVDFGFRLPSAIDNRPLQVRRVPRPGSASW